MAPMPRRVSSGKTVVAKLRKLASKQLSGSWQVSKGKLYASILRRMAGSLWPVKPTKPDFAVAPGVFQGYDDAA